MSSVHAVQAGEIARPDDLAVGRHYYCTGSGGDKLPLGGRGFIVLSNPFWVHDTAYDQEELHVAVIAENDTRPTAPMILSLYEMGITVPFERRHPHHRTWRSP